MKIKVKEYCGNKCSFNMHIVDFCREDGITYAVVIADGGVIKTYNINDLIIDYYEFMK